MRRPLFIALSAVFAIATVAAASLHSTTENISRPPNILTIMLDDFGYNDLGANGNSKTPTPNLDALAAEGIRYTRHYAHASCAIARAALMTGRFPTVHGFRPNRLGLSVGTPTIASMLHDAGYRTQHIGKWHVGTATLEQSPSQLGFDDWFGVLHHQEFGGPSPDGITYSKPAYINPWLRDNQSALQQHPGHLTSILTDRAIRFLDKQKRQSKPWFLNLWYLAPHTPIQPDPVFRDKYPATREGRYHALIDQLDSDIGRLMATLEHNGQHQNTLVIVLSDNGGLAADTNSNYPYHGKKNTFHEGGLRTPLLMRWPRHIQPNLVSDDVVSLYDIFPTIAQASAATPPAQLIGRNILAASYAPSPQLYWEYSDSETYSYSILSTDGRWRFTEGTWVTSTLNDLVADPSGKENVLERHPELAARLREEYLALRKPARVVEFSYEQLNDSGAAILRGNDLQRSPGYSGFTFAIGVTPAMGGTGAPQVIIEQADRWRLQSSAEQGLRLDVPGQSIEAPPLPEGQCSELVISTYFNFTTVNPKNNWSIISMYINGEQIKNVRMELPPLLTQGYANPTYIGINARGGESFLGKLSRPMIWNERVVPDEESTMTGNGISDVPATCPPAPANAPV